MPPHTHVPHMLNGTNQRLLSLAALLVSALCACKKTSVCERIDTVKPEFPWDTSSELVPRGAQVCGVFPRARNQLLVAFPKDTNPFVRVVNHLESLGFQRVRQDISKSTLLFVDFRKGDRDLSVVLTRTDGQWEGEFEMTSSACTLSPAKDGSGCVDDPPRVVACKNETILAYKQTCGKDEICTERQRDHSKAPTAHCITLTGAVATPAAAAAQPAGTSANGAATEAQCAALDSVVDWLFASMGGSNPAIAKVHSSFRPTIKTRITERCKSEHWAAVDVTCMSDAARRGDEWVACPPTADTIGKAVMTIMSDVMEEAVARKTAAQSSPAASATSPLRTTKTSPAARPATRRVSPSPPPPRPSPAPVADEQ